MNRTFLSSWRASFFTGLAVVLPAVVSLTVVFWLFFTISGITDTLLIFVPHEITHRNNGDGPMYWYWSLTALVVAIILTSLVGLFARHYLGKKLIKWVDASLLSVPLLNKIYGATKQVNDAFSSGSKSSFKTVVLIEWPRAGMRSIGFLTSEQNDEIKARTGEQMVCVFVPTTPNPTSGFLILVPDNQVTRLDMSVADGIKFIISLGAISPEYVSTPARKITVTD